MLCLQEDLRAQLRKMEAGASDKDKVEAPNGIMEMCSIFYCTDKCEKRKRTRARFVLCVSWIRMELSRCTDIFLQCTMSGAKMLRLLFLGWAFMNVARHDKAWYHYKDVCACWESMRLSTLHRLAISSTVSTLTSFSQYGRASTFWTVLVIKNDSGTAPFWSGNYISHHRPSTNVDSMAFPQTCQIARVRGRPKRVPKSISKCNFVRRKTYVSSFRRWKPALPTMKPWRFLGYAEMNSFSIGFPRPRWAVFIWEEASYG